MSAPAVYWNTHKLTLIHPNLCFSLSLSLFSVCALTCMCVCYLRTPVCCAAVSELWRPSRPPSAGWGNPVRLWAHCQRSGERRASLAGPAAAAHTHLWHKHTHKKIQFEQNWLLVFCLNKQAVFHCYVTDGYNIWTSYESCHIKIETLSLIAT